MKLQLNYIGFAVSDMNKALAFYRTLGLPIPAEVDAWQDHVEIEVGGLRIAWDDQKMLAGLPGGWTPPTTGGRVGVGVQADAPAEVDAAVERVRAAGYAVKTEPWDAFWGQRYAVVLDPDGTSIDVFAWLK